MRSADRALRRVGTKAVRQMDHRFHGNDGPWKLLPVSWETGGLLDRPPHQTPVSHLPLRMK